MVFLALALVALVLIVLYLCTNLRRTGRQLLRTSLELGRVRGDAQTAAREADGALAASLHARETEAALRLKLEREHRRLLEVGVNPYLFSIIRSITGVQNADPCMIGPRGCQTHPGFTMAGPDRECGAAWLRNWLLDGKAQEERPAFMAIGGLLAEHQEACGLLAGILRDAQPRFASAADNAGHGDAGWAARHQLRLISAFIDAFATADGQSERCPVCEFKPPFHAERCTLK